MLRPRTFFGRHPTLQDLPERSYTVVRTGGERSGRDFASYTGGRCAARRDDEMSSMSVWDLLTDERGFFIDGRPVRIWENPEARLRVSPDDFRTAVDSGDWVRAFNVVMLLSALESEDEEIVRGFNTVCGTAAPLGA